MRTASGLAMVIVLVLLLGAAGGAMKLYVDRQSMADVIDEYGQTLAALPQSSPQATQAFMAAAEDVRAGRFAEAKSQLQRGRTAATQAGTTPAIPGLPQLPGIFGAPEAPQAEGEAAPTPEQVEQALQSLPENARPFFAQRRELFRRALALSMAARRVAPDKWEAHRAKILQAAAAGDEKRVEEAMATARRELGLGRAGGVERRQGRLPAPGGPQGRGPMPGGPGVLGGPNMSPDQVRMALEQARQMLAGAKSMGMDTGKISAILDRADRELKAGHPEKASQALREAFEAAQAAMRGGGGRPGQRPGGPGVGGGPPRMAMARPGPGSGGWRPGGRAGTAPGGAPGGMPSAGMWPFGGGQAGGPGGSPAGILPNVLGPVMSVMEREAEVLKAVMEDIENASVALRERNQEQIREILTGARNKVASLSKQREKLQQQLATQQAAPRETPSERPARSERPGGQEPRVQRPERPMGRGRAGDEGGAWPGQSGTPFPMLPGFGMGGWPSLQAIHDTLGQALDEVRQMSDEQYQRDREGAIQRLLWALLAAVMSQSGAVGPEIAPTQGSGRLPPISVPAEEPVDEEARSDLDSQIRARLRLLREPCSALAQIGVDVGQVEAALTQAREAVNSGRLMEAAMATNQVADMVWQLVEANKAQLDALTNRR